MNDPEQSANAPKSGATGGRPCDSSAASLARGKVEPDIRDGHKPTRSGRRARRPKRQPDRQDSATGKPDLVCGKNKHGHRAKSGRKASNSLHQEAVSGTGKSPAAAIRSLSSAELEGTNAGGDSLPQPSKKKRKRRRSRKVFVRDGTAQAANGAVSAVSTDAVSAPACLNGVASSANVPPRAQLPEKRWPVLTAAYLSRTGPDRHNGPAPVYAALDLGTNNCRLLVAIPGRPGQFRVIDAFSRIVRLGEGLASSGYLSEAAMDRAVEALKICADKLGARNVRKARLIATEACRAAGNGAEFLARVETEAKLKLEIIDRRTEARLAVSGCGPLVERGTEGVVLFDIGGGSSEIALIDLSRQRTPRLANHIVSWTSLPVGVVSLAERFGGRNVTPAVFEAMIAEVGRLLEDFEGREKLAHLASGAHFHLLGTSGTVTTLAGVHLGLERYDRRRVDGLWMESSDVDAMLSRLLSWNFEQRVANPCIGADRADLVLAGCAILEAIRRRWPSERLRVADRGLREGMLSELMADDGVWRRNRRETYSR